MYNKESNPQNIILIVCKEKNCRYELSKIFIHDYKVLEASDTTEALSYALENEDKIKAIIVEFLVSDFACDNILYLIKRLTNNKHIPVIVISHDSSAILEENFLKQKVADYILKPYNEEIVYQRVKRLAALYESQKKLEMKNLEMRRTIAWQKQQFKKNQIEVLNMLTSMVEFRNLESGDHIYRIKELVNILAVCVKCYYPEYKLNSKSIEKITTASMVHDIGKIAIPDQILLKPDKLTQHEYEIMKMHTIEGCKFLTRIKLTNDSDFFKYCYDICKSHHEKYDGNGYPEGLKGDEIPIAAQITSIADVYDALVSKRVYKAAINPEIAYAMIINGECGAFNPKLLRCFSIVKNDFEVCSRRQKNTWNYMN